VGEIMDSIVEILNTPIILGLAFVVLIETVMIGALRFQVKRLNTTPANGADGAASAKAEGSGSADLVRLYEQALKGSLDRFQVTEIIQLLNTMRETGVLDIVDATDDAVHRVMVREGEIVDAFNADQRGEDAVAEILRCNQGVFAFIRGDLPSAETTIKTSTMTLLMENFQALDESMEQPRDKKTIIFR
jgi:hypothetical protein